jgi:xanthine dehydrogenase accessory factor
MNDLNVWKFIQSELRDGMMVMLMVVVDLKGSTPGRPGFKMAVSGGGGLTGSVGGGVMEFNMVNIARDMLNQNDLSPVVMRQVHNANAEADRSGLLCSGLQVNLLYPLESVHLEIVDAIVAAYESGNTGILDLEPDYIGFDPVSVEGRAFHWDLKSDEVWSYQECIGKDPVLHVFGGGHLSVPLSQVFSMLGFKVVIYDDRHDLNTMLDNEFAHEKKVVDYKDAGLFVEEGEHSYVAIMTVSHASDALILEQMLSKRLKYLGMIGSRNKVKKIFEDLTEKGAALEDLRKIDSPMGLPIGGQTTAEIAISIAAKVIQLKNENVA